MGIGNEPFKDAIRAIPKEHRTMENYKEHPLIALQFNLGAAPKRNQKRQSGTTSKEPIPVETENGTAFVSRHIGKHLICEYLKQSLVDLPAFVALQDNLSSGHIRSIRDALDGSLGIEKGYNCVASLRDEKAGLPSGKTAALLYDSTLLIHDAESALKDHDFFHGRPAKAKRLFKRLDGGLFLHIPSNRWVVAVSYHGEKNDSKEVERKEYISGTLTHWLGLMNRIAIESAQKVSSENTNVHGAGRFQL